MCAVKLDKILDTTHSKKSLEKAPSVLKVIRLLLFLRHLSHLDQAMKD